MKPPPPLGDKYPPAPQNDAAMQHKPCAQSRGTEGSYIKLLHLTQAYKSCLQQQDGNLQEHFFRLPLVPGSCHKSWREKAVKQLDDLHSGTAMLHGTACHPHQDVPGLLLEAVKPDACRRKHEGEEMAEKYHMQSRTAINHSLPPCSPDCEP